MTASPLRGTLWMFVGEQALEGRFGVPGLLCALLIGAGVRERNATWIAVGLLFLAALLHV